MASKVTSYVMRSYRSDCLTAPQAVSPGQKKELETGPSEAIVLRTHSETRETSTRPTFDYEYQMREGICSINATAMPCYRETLPFMSRVAQIQPQKQYRTPAQCTDMLQDMLNNCQEGR